MFFWKGLKKITIVPGQELAAEKEAWAFNKQIQG